jgi:hypothetical protein
MVIFFDTAQGTYSRFAIKKTTHLNSIETPKFRKNKNLNKQKNPSI